MKRTLITAAALYLLYGRQKDMEMRLREQRAYTLAVESAVADGFGQIGEWQRSLVKQIEEAFR